MDPWQKQVIIDSLPDLIKTINCDPILVANLQKFNDLSDAEVDQLNAIREKMKKAEYLLNVLKGKPRALEHLATALSIEKQSGAFNILLKGIQKHAIFRDVYFGGVRIPLENVSQSIDKETLEHIIESEVNEKTYEQFLNSEPWTLANSTLPVENKYYIPRTLSINAEVSPEIFQKLNHDIFCIEGAELHQLSGLTSRMGKGNSGQTTNQPDRSINQRHEVNTRFILLDRHNHFLDIARKTEKPVHWLKYEEGKYMYIKSSPRSEIKNVSKFVVSKAETKLTEDEFVERSVKTTENEPVFIYDSPGMGKSVLLARLARKMKAKRPEDSVIHFEISELVRKVRQIDKRCSCAAVKQLLLDCVAANGLGRRIMRDLLGSRGHQIHLFLDGYDEVLQSDSSDAHRMLDNLVKEGKNIRIFVATRPHRRDELEEKFGVLGYNILPFDSSNKLSFFLKYWHSEHGVEPNDEINKFAEHCLKTLQFEMSSEDGDIAGIPLQCRMLADIYAEDAKAGGLISTETQFQLNSVLQVYKHFIDTKFTTFCSDEDRKMCYDFHVREALRTLFPENSAHFHEDLPVPQADLVYRIGILEPLKSDSSRPGFSHRTLAEYFAAEFLATSVTSEFALQRDFIDLLFQQSLTWSVVEREVFIFRLLSQKVKEANFENPVLCRFLNFSLSTLHSEGGNLKGLKSVFRESRFYNSKTLIRLLESSLAINAVHLYLFLLDIYLDLEESNHKTTCLLRFKDNLQDTQNLKVKEANKGKLLNDLRKAPDFNRWAVYAVIYSSLNLVKLSCALFESVTGKKFFEVQYGEFVSPMYYALQRGHYQIFEYLLSFDKEGFYEQPLLHWCLEYSHGGDMGEKVEIVKRILNEKPDLLNKPHPDKNNEVPLLADSAHFSLIKILIEAGADLTQTNKYKQNIAHITAAYFSTKEYHELVRYLISKNAQIIFQQRDEDGRTPVHRALRWIDLKSETLELLAKKCNVTFNDNSNEWGSELAIAIKKGRSERVVNDIIRLGSCFS